MGTEMKRIVYFDYLRMLSVFAVILIHIPVQDEASVAIGSLSWNVGDFYDSVSSWGVPVFVMISGALFLGRGQSINKMYSNYIHRMIIVYLFWSAMYAFWDYAFLGRTNSLEAFVGNLIAGRTHLWFLPMIIGLYMIVPFLNRVVENRQIAWYYIFLSIVFAFFIPQGISTIRHFYGGFSDSLSTFYSNMNMQFVLGYSGYYVLGYMLHTTELNNKQVLFIFVAGILGLVLTFVNSSCASLSWLKPIGINDYFSIKTLLLSIAVFAFGKLHLQILPQNAKRMYMLTYLSKCSFGVYLIHVFIIDLLTKFGLSSLSIKPIILLPIAALLVYCVSFVISCLLNRIQIINRWLM